MKLDTDWDWQKWLETAKAAQNVKSENLTAGNTNSKRPHQADFFVADLLSFSFKDDQATMEAPIFSLSTKVDKSFWSWTSADGKKTVNVVPGFYGRATQHDKDVLIYCISQLVSAVNSGKTPQQTIRFTACDFLIATNRCIGGEAYDRLRDALNRLAGTRISTNITTNKKRASKGFGIVDSWQVVEKSLHDGRMVAVEVKLSDWLFNAINAKEVLTINPAYFSLRKPLERRLYEIARKHVGNQGFWSIDLSSLREKTGSRIERLRQFKSDLDKIIQTDLIPDYRIRFTEDNQRVIFYLKDQIKIAKFITKK